MPIEEKQQVLETIDLKARMKLVLELLNRKREILKLSNKIDSAVKGEMSKTQREYYLRQQLKAIKEELGELGEEEEELDELAERLKKAGLPPEVDKVAQKELNRLKSIPTASSEYTVARTYLDWIADLPWAKKTDDNLDIENARGILDADHYGLEKIKKRILEYLAVRKLKNDMRGPILCFVGPPGVGKTSLGQSIARAIGRKFVRLSLGGVRDEAEIRGHRRTYVGALPGRIIQAMKKAATINPVIMLDEIDKLGADFRGDPSAALLEVLDPEQNFTLLGPLPRPRLRPVEGDVHRDGEPARPDPRPAQGPHGDPRAARLHLRGEGPHRAEPPRPEAAQGARARRRTR